jgi:hypothetical protein
MILVATPHATFAWSHLIPLSYLHLETFSAPVPEPVPVVEMSQTLSSPCILYLALGVSWPTVRWISDTYLALPP